MPRFFKNGETIRLEIIFNDYNGTPEEPNIITFKTLTPKGIVLEEHILSSANRTGAGTYFYNYTIPNSINDQKIIYEFKGESVIEGQPVGTLSLERGEINSKFY